MKRFTRILVLIAVGLVGGCGSRISQTAEAPQEPPLSAGTIEATPTPGCIDFDHPETSRHANLIMMVGSRLEGGARDRCFQVHRFVETGVATDEGFTQLAVLLEQREMEVDTWVFDWTNLRLSPVGTFRIGELVQVEVVDPGRRAILVSASNARSQTGIVFVPNRRDSSVPQDAYVPASACLVLQHTTSRPWWRTEPQIEAHTENLIVEYIGVDAESFHQESLLWNPEEQRYALPDGWLSRETSPRTCFYPAAASPEVL